MDAGRFDKARDLNVWPYPENAGMLVDRDDGLRVTAVMVGSLAGAAGLRPGDQLAVADGRRLFSQADLRGVLHRAPVAGPVKVDLRWLRNGKVQSGTLDLPDGWRRTDLSWRTSVAHGNVGAYPGFWPTDADGLRDRLGIAKDRMAVKPHFGFGKQPPGPAQKAGLKANDVIVAVNGESPNLTNREWNAWFRTRFEPGDEVTLSVKNEKGEVRDVTYRPGK